MPKTKSTMSTLVAAIAFSALATAQASANWLIEGTELKTTAALSTTASVNEFTKLLTPSLAGLTIECSGSALDIVSPVITGPGNTGKAQSLKFLSCNTVKPATGCRLSESNQTIPTLAVNASVVLHLLQDRVTLTPQTKKTLAEINFSELNTCALAGVQPLKGPVTLKAFNGRTEEIAQPIEGLGSVENNSLEIGQGNKTFLFGSASLKLATGSKWSFD